jgi:glycosyltransferase involved in cell wall biosynthesis
MERSTFRISAVVPAYNEEKRIRGVIDALKRSGAMNEVIVVSDGSTDRTFDLIRDDPEIQAYQLHRNLGKAGAMHYGAIRAHSDWILFLDADLIGLGRRHIDDLVEPIRKGVAEMSVGLFNGGRWLTDLSQFLAPSISGQRVVSRDFFLSLPDIEDVRYGVEMAIGYHARRQKLRIANVQLSGVTHPMKEEKLGALRGLAARSRMYCEMGRYFFHARRAYPYKSESLKRKTFSNRY